jgi:hypothetical protein
MGSRPKQRKIFCILAKNIIMDKKEALAKIEELKEYVEKLDRTTYKVGDRFQYAGEIEDCFILAQVSCAKVCLISLKSGNRWIEPVKVNSLRKITQEEFDGITSYDYLFTKI